MWNNLISAAIDEIGGTLQRNVRAAACYGAAFIIALGSITFTLGAAYLALRASMSGIEASLLIAGALIVLAACLALAGFLQKNRRSNDFAATSTALLALPIAAKLVVSRVNWGPTAIAAILAAGVLMGRQLGPRRRR